MANETPSRPPPPFMANAILNFHFDYLNPSLINFPFLTLPLAEKPLSSILRLPLLKKKFEMKESKNWTENTLRNLEGCL